MFVQKIYSVEDFSQIQAVMRDKPFATLIGHSEACLEANHLPLFYCAEDEGYGVLRGHQSRVGSF